jgi:hypothetical protein
MFTCETVLTALRSSSMCPRLLRDIDARTNSSATKTLLSQSAALDAFAVNSSCTHPSQHVENRSQSRATLTQTQPELYAPHRRTAQSHTLQLPHPYRPNILLHYPVILHSRPPLYDPSSPRLQHPALYPPPAHHLCPIHLTSTHHSLAALPPSPISSHPSQRLPPSNPRTATSSIDTHHGSTMLHNVPAS